MTFGSKLEDQQKQKLKECFRKFKSRFPTENRPLGTLTGSEHVIETEDIRPISQPPYRWSWAERMVVKTEVDKMVKAGTATPSQSPWASPIVLVKKKDGSTRFCTDYRKLISVYACPGP